MRRRGRIAQVITSYKDDHLTEAIVLCEKCEGSKVEAYRRTYGSLVDFGV